ncbi:MAG: cofactor-independent phosphoglycerate mutase [Oscillospiraceae bacterium]|nr:cofactor-independent phosphoglycerate mutase [Oscillospiraceae bacterium]
MKYILVIGDGMADNPVPELGGKTPLQYADTPAMDTLAGAGLLGSVLTVPEGMPAGSDTAILSIFGADPHSCYGGRASLEAAATGIKLNPGDVAYRCNIVAFETGTKPFEDKKILSHSAGAIDGDISDTLIKDLFNTPAFKEAAEKAGITVYPGNSFRHIVVQKPGQTAAAASADELVLIPPHDHIGEPLGLHLPRGNENAKILTGLIKLANEILEEHPINIERSKSGELSANGIWFWAQGVATKLPNFEELYGKSGSIISAVPLCQGIGVLMGLEKILVEGATGELDTNYEGKVDAVINSLESHDFAAVHIEAPDECTHNGDLKGKLQAIEWIDSRVIAPLVKRLSGSGIQYKVLIISDHKTLISTRGHSGEPVPFILYDSRENKENKLCYNEEDAGKGEFVPVGTKLMEMLFQ